MTKLSKGIDISTDVLKKICDTLDCTLDHIVEFVDGEAVR